MSNNGLPGRDSNSILYILKVFERYECASVSMSEVAEEFVKYFYSTLDSGASNIAPLYQDHSTLTFEGVQCQGIQKIVEKYVVCSIKPPR